MIEKRRIPEWYIIKHGFYIDLYDDGAFIIDGYEYEYDTDSEHIFLTGEYLYGGWAFYPAILEAEPEDPEEPLTSPWSWFGIYPGSGCTRRLIVEDRSLAVGEDVIGRTTFKGVKEEYKGKGDEE